MRIKFPKKIVIDEMELLVETAPDRVGGEFYSWEESEKGKIKKGKLIIGTKLLKTNPVRVLAIIIHELKEAIQVNQCVRYQRPDMQDAYEFHYDHRQHTDFCNRLAGLLSEFLN